MSSSELVPVQLPSRRHVIGAPKPEGSVHYFTADVTFDALMMGRLRTKAAFFSMFLDPSLGSKAAEPRCTAVRDLLEGTADAGSIILTCEKEHHMDVHAHRMTNPDGSVTTWRH